MPEDHASMTYHATLGATQLESLPQHFNAATDLLDHNLLAGRGSKPAYVDDRGVWTYDQLSERVDRVGALLQDLGVAREQRVLLCLQDDIDFPSLFLGAMKAGVVPIPVNTLFGKDDYVYLLQDSRARVAFVSAALAPVFTEVLSLCPDLLAVVVSGDGPDELEVRLRAAQPVPAAAATCRDEAAFWLYTSGSTGRPKGVVHTHGSLRLTASLYGLPVMGVREEDVVFSVAKLFFAYGLGNALTFPLAAGATTVLLRDRPTPQAVRALLAAQSVSVLCAAPTFFAGFLSDERAPRRADLPNLRIATSAGEALPEALGSAFTDRYGVEILDGLGSTEMLHIFLSQRAGAVRYGVTGKPVPGYELRIVDEQGRICADGELGDLQVRGPTAAACYWNNRPKTRDTFLGDWTQTGDKYARDAEGWYRYAGRRDDMLKVSGIYVSPFDVEEALAAHPAVLEAAVVGWPDANGLMKIRAFVVCRDPGEANDDLARALQAHVKSRLAPHCYPRSVEFRTDLPKTATGKLQRYLLREGH
ncbi:benzoate-CoA ligase family protein [Phenylobacterium sp.]|jgi:benzoate-CoA ligase|uniref:benzoate-CoA ligase family protein n=1 Tax=Phenylobacterium sp. TaxID=1871053 RepID=UPI003783E325